MRDGIREREMYDRHRVYAEVDVDDHQRVTVTMDLLDFDRTLGRPLYERMPRPRPKRTEDAA